jgi:hypothetical protein
VKGQAYFGAHRYEEAITIFNQVRELTYEANAWLAASYALVGRSDEARSAMQQFMDIAKRDMRHFPSQQSEQWAKYIDKQFPYQYRRDSEHLLEGLRRAGLPI